MFAALFGLVAVDATLLELVEPERLQRRIWRRRPDWSGGRGLETGWIRSPGGVRNVGKRNSAAKQ